jgi:hypothetical protein
VNWLQVHRERCSLYKYKYLKGCIVAAFVAGALVLGFGGLSAADDLSPRHEVKELASPVTMNPLYWVPEQAYWVPEMGVL